MTAFREWLRLTAAFSVMSLASAFLAPAIASPHWARVGCFVFFATFSIVSFAFALLSSRRALKSWRLSHLEAGTQPRNGGAS